MTARPLLAWLLISVLASRAMAEALSRTGKVREVNPLGRRTPSSRRPHPGPPARGCPLAPRSRGGARPLPGAGLDPFADHPGPYPHPACVIK